MVVVVVDMILSVPTEFSEVTGKMLAMGKDEG